MAWEHNRYSKWAASGLLLGVGFLHPYLWVLGIFGGAYFIHLLLESKGFREACLGAWLAWSVKAGCAVWWFWSTYPIEWLPVQLGEAQLLIIFGYWLTASVWLGMGGLVIAAALKTAQKFYPHKNKVIHLYILTVPIMWLVGELFGSLMFSVFSFGPGGSVNASFSFGYGGYLLAQHEILLQVARVAGVYGLSFLFALCAVLLYTSMVVKKKYRRMAAVVVGVVYATSFGVFFNTEPAANTNDYQVVTIDTHFPSALFTTAEGIAEKQTALEAAVSVALEQDPEYILLPEDARFFDQRRSADFVRSFFSFQRGSPEVVIVDSGRVETDNTAVLQTFIYNGNNTVEQIHKRYLVPAGEYLPTFYTKALDLLGFSDVASEVAQTINYEVGDQTDQAGMAKNTPGILFCSESIDPRGVRTIKNERPDLPFVAHAVSHAWFHEPRILWYQLDTMLKVQAVWNQVYIVSAANQAEGKVYTPEGLVYVPSVIAEGDDWEVKQVRIPRMVE